MKTRLVIEIESPDIMNKVIPFNENEEPEEDETIIEQRRKEMAVDIHKAVVDKIKDMDSFEEEFIEGLEELYIEDWDDLSDYGIKIKINVDKEK